VNSAALGKPSFCILLGIGLLLAFLPLLAGCNPDGYSTDLKYPLRADPFLPRRSPRNPRTRSAGSAAGHERGTARAAHRFR